MDADTRAAGQLGSHDVRVRANDGQTVVFVDFADACDGYGTSGANVELQRATGGGGQPLSLVGYAEIVRCPVGSAAIEVFDLRGRRLRRVTWPTGARQLTWDARDSAGHPVAAGVYFSPLFQPLPASTPGPCASIEQHKHERPRFLWWKRGCRWSVGRLRRYFLV